MDASRAQDDKTVFGREVHYHGTLLTASSIACPTGWSQALAVYWVRFTLLRRARSPNLQGGGKLTPLLCSKKSSSRLKFDAHPDLFMVSPVVPGSL